MSSPTANRRLLAPDDASALVDRIRLRKRQRKWTWEQLQHRLEVDRRTLLRWMETGRVGFDKGVLVARKLGVQLGALSPASLLGTRVLYPLSKNRAASAGPDFCQLACYAGACLLASKDAPKGLRMTVDNGVCTVCLLDGDRVIGSVVFGKANGGLAYRLESAGEQDRYCGAGAATSLGIAFCGEFLRELAKPTKPRGMTRARSRLRKALSVA